jgi:two-component system cell cycle response regulator CtrA
MRLLLVEEAQAGNALQFCDDRSFVARCNLADEALLILDREAFDLVIVDVVSLAEAGFAFIQRLRLAKNDTPLVVLTGQQSSDRVRALNLGADDAVAQPFNLDELRARILTVARRHKGHKPSLLQVGGLSLSLKTHEVMFENIPVHLTASEYSMLELLILRKGQIITKNMFLNHLYRGMDEPEAKIIDVFICKLRRKLDQVGAKGVIGTVWGQGYVVQNQSGEVSFADAPVLDDSRQRATGLSAGWHAEN